MSYRHASRSFLAGMFAVVMCCSAQAQEGRGTYVGVFGGGGAANVGNFSQVGTALFPDTAGGPLAVNAQGSASSANGIGIVGLQIGREGQGRELANGWRLLPAGELEGYYMGGTLKADVFNDTPRVPGHSFIDTLPMNNAVLLTNAVFSVQGPGRLLAPYVGLGVGAASINISGADSLQTVFPEPGINHFNSGTDSSCWGLAFQTKLGARVNLTDRLWVFGEYRFLYVSSTTYTFGSTVFPGHAPTTPWTVHLGDMTNHMAVGGIGLSF